MNTLHRLLGSARRTVAPLLLLAASVRAQTASPAVRFDSAAISGLAARNIGSATMSGRVAALTGMDGGGRLTVDVGSGGGGVWKSVNGANTFPRVFDDQSVQTIGAIAIGPNIHKIVWAGTGESWLRNSVSIGDGIYKS